MVKIFVYTAVTVLAMLREAIICNSTKASILFPSICAVFTLVAGSSSTGDLPPSVEA
jgi:hypothetical protein